jgi:hypothetical protein
MHRTWWVAFALLVAAVTAMAASEGRNVEPVTHIGIYVTPYYASADKPDGRPHVNVARAYDEKLASNKREDILAVRDAIKAQPQMLTPMTLMVLAIRLFDVGERDESVFWFYVAKDRYRTLVGVLDVRSPALGSVPATVRDFATLAGEFINGYAFCDLAKQRAARAKAFAWVEANRYEVLFMEQLPALPGDRSENLSKALATIRQSMDEENRELDDRAAYDDILRARQETGTDMKYCPGGKNALEAGPRDPNRPRGRNPFKAKDGKVTYFNLPGTPYPVADANAATFRHVGGLYGKDVRRVYYGKDVVKGAEPGSFQFLGRQAGRDAKAVYISGDLCPTCDPATFRVLDDTDEYEITNWYVDKNTVFEDNRPHPDMIRRRSSPSTRGSRRTVTGSITAANRSRMPTRRASSWNPAARAKSVARTRTAAISTRAPRNAAATASGTSLSVDRPSFPLASRLSSVGASVKRWARNRGCVQAPVSTRRTPASRRSSPFAMTSRQTSARSSSYRSTSRLGSTGPSRAPKTPASSRSRNLPWWWARRD